MVERKRVMKEGRKEGGEGGQEGREGGLFEVSIRWIFMEKDDDARGTMSFNKGY